ncbi:Lrp/AsnC family transcriptional regulator [Psychromonas sp. 14N.309.X.WAT.B.A12]|uniref:Lrp/AsnC family transcriptional regulator n=1 Tax=unclassified Psychromonas TaxID=2614957 RepID=UPI0025B0DE9C|nr:Lrp/AsnC family transcriptional regulator [Psychromonas sp. 14N.309.X.WAT.B.A12]MDN2663481.1 Lrp/AsnC family transcriptional regulator [Psychromonas sp. 14N.309.X.WAT.B.A12]
MKNLDRIDYKILDVLQSHARITNQELASRIALAPSSCLQRVRRLEEDGVIEGFHARVNLYSICRFVTCIANVDLKNHSYQEMLAFVEVVKSIPEIVEYYTVSGQCDFILKVICRDMRSYLEINDKLISSPDYVATINTHVVLNEDKAFTKVNLDTLS